MFIRLSARLSEYYPIPTDVCSTPISLPLPVWFLVWFTCFIYLCTLLAPYPVVRGKIPVSPSFVRYYALTSLTLRFRFRFHSIPYIKLLSKFESNKMLYSSTALCSVGIHARVYRRWVSHSSFSGVLVRTQRSLAVRDELAERVHRHRLGPLKWETKRYMACN